MSVHEQIPGPVLAVEANHAFVSLQLGRSLEYFDAERRFQQGLPRRSVAILNCHPHVRDQVRGPAALHETHHRPAVLAVLQAVQQLDQVVARPPERLYPVDQQQRRVFRRRVQQRTRAVFSIDLLVHVGKYWRRALAHAERREVEDRGAAAADRDAVADGLLESDRARIAVVRRQPPRRRRRRRAAPGGARRPPPRGAQQGEAGARGEQCGAAWRVHRARVGAVRAPTGFVYLGLLETDRPVSEILRVVISTMDTDADDSDWELVTPRTRDMLVVSD